METTLWESLRIFNSPLNPDQIKFNVLEIKIPEGVSGLIENNWKQQLKDKQKELEITGTVTNIAPYKPSKNGPQLEALYSDGKLLMWPGPAVILEDIKDTVNGVDLCVSQASFPLIKALQDPEVFNLYRQQKITIPRPPLAICTFVLTKDNKLTLTVRGGKTNMYPGRFYGQGGNPHYVTTNIVDHQVDEINDEIYIDKSEYNTDAFRFLGVIADKDQLPRKPDLLGWVPVGLTSRDIADRVHRVSSDRRPNDAANVVFIPADAESLMDYLVNTPISSFCPPAHGGLVLYGNHKFGSNWVKTLLKAISAS